MKIKRKFFYVRKQWEHHLYFAANGFMRSKRYKNETTVRYGIRLQPKRRRRRSIAVRNLKQLYNYTFTELLCAEMEFDEGAFDSHHGVDYKWVKKHRVCAYHY